MEALNNYNFSAFNFALWFFRIVLAIITTMVVLVFVLKINETVIIRQGEIVAANPQSDYKAPFEAEILKTNVREGQPVKANDTLITMRNVDFADQDAKIKAEIEYLNKKIKSIAVLQSAVQRRRAALDQATEITSKKYQLEINRLMNDMKKVDEQYNFQMQRLSSANEKYAGDSILFKKDMLSKYEYNNTRDATLALKENLAALQHQLRNQASEKKLTYNNLTREQNTLALNRVQLEENAQALIQARSEFESQLVQSTTTLKRLQNELKKQYVIAAAPGIVNYLFNTKQTSNLINKGDLLVSVAPQSVSYYAKVTVPEKDMPYMRAGLDAHLKLDAYHNYEKGMIYGKVSYVAERKEKEQFYALVELSALNKFQLKSGFTVYGEIIVDRLPLYKYFVKKIFKRFDQA